MHEAIREHGGAAAEGACGEQGRRTVIGDDEGRSAHREEVHPRHDHGGEPIRVVITDVAQHLPE